MTLDLQRFVLGYGVAVAAVYVFVVVAQYALGSLRPKNFPPGPRVLPFVGNAHHFATPMPFLKFAEWQKTYGDLIGLKVGRGNLVIVNDADLARELLERRAAIYSGRAVPRSIRAVIGASEHIVSVQNGADLRKWRTSGRLLVGAGEAGRAMLPRQDAASAALARRVLREPDRFLGHLRAWGLTAPLLAICGLRRGEWDEAALVRTFYDTQDEWLRYIAPGRAPLVDLFPALRFVPACLAGWKRSARRVRARQREFYFMLLDLAKREKARNDRAAAEDKGSAVDPESESLMTKLLRQRDEAAARGDPLDPSKHFDDEQLAFFGGSFLDGAVDTTHSAALIFIKALLAHPEVLKRAQAEVDAVCGGGDGTGGGLRIPGGEDLPNLPYLRACFLEVLRWRPPTPMTLPHRMDAPDVVRGYVLPRDTVVLQNTWAINQNPAYYDHPERFDPDRYLRSPTGSPTTTTTTAAAADDSKGHDSPGPVPEGRKATYVFGEGRRSCPGDLFAQRSVLIALSKLVWAADILPCEGDGPPDCAIETGFHDGLVVGSEPFRARFVERDPARTRMLDEAVENSTI